MKRHFGADADRSLLGGHTCHRTERHLRQRAAQRQHRCLDNQQRIFCERLVHSQQRGASHRLAVCCLAVSRRRTGVRRSLSISSNPVSGTFYFEGTINFTQSGCVGNGFGFNVCLEQSDSFNGPSLNAGTYWLNMQNAVVSSGDPVYWDENDGPSTAVDSSLGTIGSEAFTLLGGHGTGTTSTTGTTPEPSSILLVGSGILGLAAVLRRRLF